ncbi:MAG: hypothetical protein FJ030_11590 [Chloroflexi bacterium]|nr:hypothetical protein [Chloroflexota bacterium]
MSFLRRYSDPGLLVAALIAALGAWPLLTRPSMPTMTDAEMHIYRVAEIASSIRQGVLYPRWAPDFYFGYGYPVFNFYSPLAYHVAAYYGLLTDTGPVAGTKFALVLAAGIGSVGMYLFGRDRWGAVPGIVSAAAFVFSPYVLYIDPHARGDVPQSLALSLAPLILWTFDRLRRTGSLLHLAFSGLTLAALILSHPLMALVVYALLLAFVGWETLISPLAPQTYLGPDPRRHVPHLAAAIGLGLGLAAFYWLPAGIDRSAVQLHNVAGPGYFDFHNYFVTLRELFSPTRYLDLGATAPLVQFNIGLVQWILALAGALTVFSRRLRRTDTFFFVFAAVGFIYLITQASVNFWEAIPIMSFFQFPTRFLAPAALAFAALAGLSVRWVERFDKTGMKVAAATGLVLVAATIVAAMPLLYPPEWGEFGKVDALRMISVEQQGRALGTTSANDFLPVGVTVLPGSQQSLLDSYKAGGSIDRLNRATLPDGAYVLRWEQRPFADKYEISSDTDFVFRVFLFYFPGWTARVDGQEVPIEVAQPDGFITFPVPAGEHTVEVIFEDTLPRRLAWGISLLALFGWIAATALAVARPMSGEETIALPMKPAIAIGVVVLLGFGLKLNADRAGWFRCNSSGTTVAVAQRPYFVQMERGLQLLAYDLSADTIRSGEPLTTTLYWKTQAPVPMNFQVYAHLIGADDQLYAQSDKLNPADFPTTRWPTTRYVRDDHKLVFQSGALPPGEYRVVVGLWNAGTGERLRPLVPVEMFADGIVLPARVTVQP